MILQNLAAQPKQKVKKERKKGREGGNRWRERGRKRKRKKEGKEGMRILECYKKYFKWLLWGRTLA